MNVVYIINTVNGKVDFIERLIGEQTSDLVVEHRFRVWLAHFEDTYTFNLRTEENLNDCWDQQMAEYTCATRGTGLLQIYRGVE
jgi:hypothetical protein